MARPSTCPGPLAQSLSEATMAQTFSVPTHPYYPQDADIPDYVPNSGSVVELMLRFGSLLSITILTALWIATRFNPKLVLSDKLVLGWFVLCKSWKAWWCLTLLDLAIFADMLAQAERFTAFSRVCVPGGRERHLDLAHEN